ncbi:hypothetical protein SCLCIDRAFT_1208949 [Scleroderma citrinum Foug A]|uniref:Uncharacterized protein n=1 Tax=Scleroderma citrinum Foug A TaxID=1036808 RepID=A0A0C3EKM2_9AGAM|nr:hypothetical protein SCLCIDRAFT_1208949 [Scleroderma citrinum Foug A]
MNARIPIELTMRVPAKFRQSQNQCLAWSRVHISGLSLRILYRNWRKMLKKTRNDTNCRTRPAKKIYDPVVSTFVFLDKVKLAPVVCGGIGWSTERVDETNNHLNDKCGDIRKYENGIESSPSSSSWCHGRPKA